jgi:hypothetical protein
VCGAHHATMHSAAVTRSAKAEGRPAMMRRMAPTRDALPDLSASPDLLLIAAVYALEASRQPGDVRTTLRFGTRQQPRR